MLSFCRYRPVSAAMSSLRTSVRRLVPPSTLTSAPHMHSTPSLLPLVPPFIVQSVRCFASPTLPRASSSQAPRSSGSAVASLGLPTGFPALQPKQVNEKTPMEYIAEVPPKEVDGSTAVCEGGQSTAAYVA